MTMNTVNEVTFKPTAIEKITGICEIMEQCRATTQEIEDRLEGLFGKLFGNDPSVEHGSRSDNVDSLIVAVNWESDKLEEIRKKLCEIERRL